jgi:hypothetical protein
MVPVMTPQGPQMQMQLLRPGMKRSEKACSLYQQQELAGVVDTEVPE